MPKVSFRQRRGIQRERTPATSAPFVATPRKVSFEDGRQQQQQSECGESSVSNLPILCDISGETQQLQRKSTMTRHKPSLSLVDLGKPLDDYESSDSEPALIAPISPVPSPRPMEQCSPYSTQGPASPWGQFVDMATIDSDESCTQPTSQTFLDKPYNCCTSSRRHRPSPYGTYRVARSTNFKAASIPVDFGSWEAPSTTQRSFRLSPRRTNNTEEIVGALHRLQMD